MSTKLSDNQIRELEAIAHHAASKSGEVRRSQAILLVNQKGIAPGIIHSLTGLTRVHAFRLKKRYLAEGISSLTDQRLGAPKELLTKKQQEEILDTLKTKMPNECGYAHNFWTTGILGAYIERQYRVKYKSKTSYRLLFRKAEFTYHKPERIYHEHNEQEVALWKKRTKPRMKKLWQEPEENPQEHVWKRGRAHVTHNRFIEDIDAATDEFVQWLRHATFPYSLLGFGNIS